MRGLITGFQRKNNDETAGHGGWGDDGMPVGPVERFLGYLTSIGRSPDTVKAYAHDLKDFFELPADHSPAPPGALTGCRRVRLAWYSRQVSQTSTVSGLGTGELAYSSVVSSLR